MLAFAAAAHVAAAAERFVPRDPGFVVANVRQSAPDQELRALLGTWRTHPEDAAAGLALATALVERAGRSREPSFYGHAESVLEQVLALPTAPAVARRLYAQTLQFRHQFARAETLLGDLLRADPRDSAARTQRASIRLVRGDFTGARADCAQLVAGRGAAGAVGLACLAEAYAGSGQLEQARALLESAAPDPRSPPAAQAYLLTIRGELRERGHEFVAALADYRAALALDAGNDALRASLADALIRNRELAAADAVLDVERPSLALVVRRVAATGGARRAELAARAQSWLALEAARGDAAHDREAAMLALATGDAPTALRRAEANFEVQRELPDVRVLARAALAANDARARNRLREWLRASGFRDAVTETILAGGVAG